MSFNREYTTLADAEQQENRTGKTANERAASLYNDVSQGADPMPDPAPVLERRTGDMIQTRDMVTLVSYLIGVSREFLEKYFPDCTYIIEDVKDLPEAKIIRYLCKARTVLMKKFGNVDHDIRYEMKNINRQEHFDTANITELEKLGVPIVQANYTAEKYLVHISKLINDRIDACRHLFPDWVKWEYIKALFYISKYAQPGQMQRERELFKKEYDNYPYHMYIHWNPVSAGLILASDRKFLVTIYSQHGDTFTDMMKIHDVMEPVKTSIYKFIDDAERVAIAVDCENSDPFKLYSVIKGLDADEVAKISKISLYDDINTTSAWVLLGKYLHIPVEHIEVERVVGRKSLVDLKMSVSVSRDYFQNGIDSFLIFSSDSDYWALISSMKEANFLVMYERDKVGFAILEAFSSHDIPHCVIDDFCSVAADDLKKIVLLDILKRRLNDVLGKKPMDLANEIYAAAKIEGSRQEVESFCEKYIKTLKLQIGEDGTLEIAIRK